MDGPTPYSLKNDGGRSTGYYQAISDFADRWLATVEVSLARPVSIYLNWRGEQASDDTEKAPRPALSFPEAAFEMLVLGVLLREHGAEALNLPSVQGWVLARLVEAQDRLPLPAIERPAKAIRGLIQGLAQVGVPQEQGPVDSLPFAEGAAPLVGRLVDWLEAGGMGAQAAHMAGWRDFLAGLPEQSAQAILARCLLLAEEFAGESQAALGTYTAGVEAFVASVEGGPDQPWARGCRARWRYDAHLVTRTAVEYHLGMLGTELLTRAYRARYLAAPRKIVIVPDCLCARSRRSETGDETRCQAELTSLGYKCQGCTPGCRVLQITRLGQKRGFEAYILPDDLRGIGLGACSALDGAGVVGVSCALTNWDAGWMVNDAGVPAQGVLLDYAGCKRHWHAQGVTTEVNLEKLLAMVG
jgi:hypothetical protein